MEGYREGRWIVIDYGDILVHIFHKCERVYGAGDCGLTETTTV